MWEKIKANSNQTLLFLSAQISEYLKVALTQRSGSQISLSHNGHPAQYAELKDVRIGLDEMMH